MKAMARQRSHSIEFKRQVAQEFIAGESLYALSKRHDISRQLIRVWVQKYEAGALDEDAQAADLLQEYEAKIAALERMVGRQALDLVPDFLEDLVSKDLLDAFPGGVIRVEPLCQIALERSVPDVTDILTAIIVGGFGSRFE